MKLNMLIPVVLASFGDQAAGQQSEFATGRAHYTEGEFRKAAAHFQLALKTNPNDAGSYYWMGMSYQGLADILQTIPECDPDYNYMSRRFAHESRVSSSPDARLGRLFLIGPRVVYRIAKLPASALSSRRTTEPRTPTR